MFYRVDNYINTYKGVISLNIVEFFDALETVRVNLDKKHSIQRGTEVLYPIYIIKMHFGKSIHDNGFGMLRNMLTYKLHDIGKEIVKIPKFYPSSQICHVCGRRTDTTKDLSIREWICPKCNTLHDRDVNVAINILDIGFSEYRKYYGIA